MTPNIRAILGDCIERGIRHAVLNKDDDSSDESFMQYIEHEIWLNIDDYFTFTED